MWCNFHAFLVPTRSAAAAYYQVCLRISRCIYLCSCRKICMQSGKSLHANLSIWLHIFATSCHLSTPKHCWLTICRLSLEFASLLVELKAFEGLSSIGMKCHRVQAKVTVVHHKEEGLTAQWQSIGKIELLSWNLAFF